jgi:hypothetical protein
LHQGQNTRHQNLPKAVGLIRPLKSRSWTGIVLRIGLHFFWEAVKLPAQADVEKATRMDNAIKIFFIIIPL